MNYEIIESVERCQKVVKELMTHHVISADAEGINLGRDGPLTLLQIGTRDGHVYLFDIQSDQDMFTGGRLKQLLESDTVLKVFHAAATDSLALKHQFDVSLNNIFDTQVADGVLHETSGRKMPKTLKLSELCEIYGSVQMEKKVEMKKKWSKVKADYWGQRPFTDEMIEYACADVRVLFPELYDNMKRMLEDKKTMPLFKERVVENTNYLNDKDVRQRRSDRFKDVAKCILRDMGKRRATDTETDDEDMVLSLTWTVDELSTDMTDGIRKLFFEKRMELLRDVEANMAEEGDDFCPTLWHYHFLTTSMTYIKPSIKKLATKLYDNMKEIAYADMARKYSADTPICHLGRLDELLLGEMSINTPEDEDKYPMMVVCLFNKRTEAAFKDFQTSLIKNPSKVTITQGYLKYLQREIRKTFTPKYVRDAGKELLKLLEKAGKCPQKAPYVRKNES